MGYDLRNEKRGFRVNYFNWRPMLQLAHEYGWKAIGTRNRYGQQGEPINDWSGTYFSNNGQTVVREDALDLADALEKVLVDIPENDCYEDKDKLRAPETKEGLLKYFSQEGFRNFLIDFIKFCREGEDGFNLGF